MARALPVLSRLRTIELRSLQAVAELAAATVRADPASRDPCELRSKLILAESHFAKISEFDLDIMEHPDLSEEDSENEARNYANNRNLGLKCIADLSACLYVGPPTNPPTTFPAGGESSSSIRADLVASEDQPPVNPPSGLHAGDSVSADVMPEPFNGDRLQYRSFIAQFDNWVNRRRSFTKLDKLIVLRKLMRGEAKTLIEGLEIIDSNYDVAVNFLQQAFGQINIERQQIMSSLFNLPRVGKSSDLAGLRNLLNAVQSCIQRMQTLGAPLSEYALALEPVTSSLRLRGIKESHDFDR